jgi:hypothetical protein
MPVLQTAASGPNLGSFIASREMKKLPNSCEFLMDDEAQPTFAAMAKEKP